MFLEISFTFSSFHFRTMAINLQCNTSILDKRTWELFILVNVTLALLEFMKIVCISTKT